MGLMSDAKEKLARMLNGTTQGRQYRESDAPKLMEIVRLQNWVRAPAAKSLSFQLFAQKIDDIGE
ncbi:hypothetical protein DEI86_14745 [Curtobacterium sp. MCBD17_028]|nr:hypothetical protein DEI86_14745 [Curtobacterium sp. MCBD17_028]